jgi:hypothetical protein
MYPFFSLHIRLILQNYFLQLISPNWAKYLVSELIMGFLISGPGHVWCQLFSNF